MRRAACAFGALLLGALGCSGPAALDSPDAGRTAAYVPGEPAFDLEVRPGTGGADAGAEFFVGLAPLALVWTQGLDGYEATFELTLLARDADDRRTLTSRVMADTLYAADAAETRDVRAVLRRYRLRLLPGTYVAEARLRDVQGEGVAVRRQRVTVPTPGAFAAGALTLAARYDGGPVEPLVSLHAPAGLDSLRAALDLTAAPAGTTVRARLLRLRADTAVAYPPYYLDAQPASLRHRGLDPEAADTLQRSVRRLDAPAASATVEVLFPPLGPGVYRIEMEAEGAGAVEARARTLAVHPFDFPRLGTMDALTDALAYLATERERDAIRSGATAEERRRLFDAFWASLVPQRAAAQGLLRLYYARVEEANLRFSGVKDGWRTDRGMLYVVFGPPEYVEQTAEGEVWHYAYATRDAASAFAFERVRDWSGRNPFPQYVLQRAPAYEAAWRRAVQRWRRGEVL